MKPLHGTVQAHTLNADVIGLNAPTKEGKVELQDASVKQLLLWFIDHLMGKSEGVEIKSHRAPEPQLWISQRKATGIRRVNVPVHKPRACNGFFSSPVSFSSCSCFCLEQQIHCCKNVA